MPQQSSSCWPLWEEKLQETWVHRGRWALKHMISPVPEFLVLVYQICSDVHISRLQSPGYPILHSTPAPMHYDTQVPRCFMVCGCPVLAPCLSSQMCHGVQVPIPNTAQLPRYSVACRAISLQGQQQLKVSFSLLRLWIIRKGPFLYAKCITHINFPVD